MATLPLIVSHVRPMNIGAAGSHVVSDENGDLWVIKPAARGALGTRATLTEYVSTRLLNSLNLPVVESVPVLLPQRLIDAETHLSAFHGGPVPATKFRNSGMSLDELRHARSSPRFEDLRISDSEGQMIAVAATTTDTWLWNADRSLGSYNSPGTRSNEGNLLFERPTADGGAWRPLLIDYDNAFYSNRWGSAAIDAWPDAVLGTMSFFFDRSYLPRDTDAFLGLASPLIDSIEMIDVTSIVGAAFDYAPPTWLDGSLGLTVDAGSVEDLCGRLTRQTESLRSIFKSHYHLAVASWEGAR